MNPGPEQISVPLRIRAMPGVWRPHHDASLLAGTMVWLGWARGASVLDVFTGSGAVAVAAARAGAADVTAVDVSRRALVSTTLNAAVNAARVKVVRGNMFGPFAGRRFDLIVANPPYIPGPEDVRPRGLERAWEGGYDGRRLIDRLCDQAADHLAPGGRLLIVHSSLNGAPRTLRALERAGLRPAVRLRHEGPLGRVSKAREQLLRSRGLLTEQDPIEETLVISGEMPTG